MEKYMERYQEWCNNPFFDDKTKEELKKIEGNIREIEDRFYKDLEFGTAGLRGVIGIGTNRMNKYTVAKATQGFANFIIKNNGQERGVAISYDSRNMSKEFSEYTALCFNANGIKTYVFENLSPVPELSFAVRELNCIAGVMITASHNPPEYNGYKVYWEDGAQVSSPKDKLIIEEVNNITDFSQAKTMNKEEAIKLGLYNTIGKEIDDKYINILKQHVINPEVIKEMQKDIKIVYSPLHGTGNIPVRRILKEIGFENVYIVKEQELPDGNFPTVDYPNPEDKNAFKLGLELAKEIDADIILATDPDADRLGVYAKDSNGEYQSFTGNMSGCLIQEYILSQKKEKNKLPKNGAVITSIVSSKLSKAIADAYGIETIEVLTGFKYIGEQIKKFEETKEKEYVFGFEESYGCLIGTYARDKDAIASTMILCEAAAFYKKQGITLFEQMLNIYEKYGYYRENIITITLKGSEGAEKIKSIMQNLKQEKINNFGKYKVLKIKDISNSVYYDLNKNTTGEINLPKSEVVYYEIENDYWCCVRPSGTEPKIKFYIGTKSNSIETSDKELEEITKEIKKIVE
ncbi:MAG: phospho-sugar mutase [Clostridia bacterium]|nr:phospho-sugar mutase [Clostridia bacterium]